MYGVGKVLNNFRDFYNNINGATLTGAIDVVIVEQPDGSYACSPFHVRFGKLGVLRSKEIVVDIEINSEPVDIHMKLGDSGEAFFVESVEGNETEDNGADQSNFMGQPSVVSDISSLKSSSSEIFPIEHSDPFAKEEPPQSLSEYMTSYIDDDNDINNEVETINMNSNVDNPAHVAVSISDPAIQNSLNDDFTPKNFEFENENSSIINVNLNDRPSCVKSYQKNDTFKYGSSDDNLLKGRNESESSDVFLNQVSTDSTMCPSTKIDFHFFSDTDVSPTLSPRGSRPSSPFQSDTELEVTRSKDNTDDFKHSQWRWGEFPSVSPMAETSSDDLNVSNEAKRSVLSNMFTYMKETKRLRHNTDTKGIYLDDLNADELDPEIAAAYLSTSFLQKKSNLRGSANEAELESLSNVNQGILNDNDVFRKLELAIPNEASNTLCSENKSFHTTSDEVPSDQNHNITKHDTELIDLQKKEVYLKDLAISLCGGIDESGPVEERFSRHVISYEEIARNPKLVEDPNLVVRLNGKYYNWNSACFQVMIFNMFGKLLPDEVIPDISPHKEDGASSPARSYSNWFSWWRSNEKKMNSRVQGKNDASPTSRNDEKFPRSLEHSFNESPSVNKESRSSISFQSAKGFQAGGAQYKKTLRLTSDQIKNLNLNKGVNEATFSVTTAYQGTTRCKCYIYLWRYDDKIVISDIDGTITKSDVLGHILPIIGKDWAQSGVAQLFNKITNNGYKLMYLSARAIGQSWLTREYLKSIKQENLQLPDGPMFLNPVSLLNAFHKEVIAKKSEEFKISCLRDIQALFPKDHQPFYAGYGNKICDVWSYHAVKIPKFRIFTINSKGEVKNEFTQTFQSTYTSMSSIVDQMFPPLTEVRATGDFSNFLYWREPIETISKEDKAENKPQQKV